MKKKLSGGQDMKATTEKLVQHLRQLFDDDEFVMGMLVYVSGLEDCRKLLDFIEKDEDVDVETVTVLALDLYDSRNER